MDHRGSIHQGAGVTIIRPLNSRSSRSFRSGSRSNTDRSCRRSIGRDRIRASPIHTEAPRRTSSAARTVRTGGDGARCDLSTRRCMAAVGSRGEIHGGASEAWQDIWHAPRSLHGVSHRPAWQWPLPATATMPQWRWPAILSEATSCGSLLPFPVSTQDSLRQEQLNDLLRRLDEVRVAARAEPARARERKCASWGFRASRCDVTANEGGLRARHRE